MKAISFKGIIPSISSKKDKSLGLRIETPELTSQERAEFMDLQGINLDILVKPLDEAPEEVTVIEKELNTKTPAQRLRSVLYVLFQQENPPETFDEYYRITMERIIETYKKRIEE